MTTLRPMVALDLFRCNCVNLDCFTENFNATFYLKYLNTCPELCIVAESVDGIIAGYIIGKVEGHGAEWHGHVTALSIAPEFRRGGLARQLMNKLESISSDTFNAFFVDLYVRASNVAAVKFYKDCGYYIYQTVKEYYSDREEALDMRKTLKAQ